LNAHEGTAARVVIDWSRGQPRRGAIDGEYLERCGQALDDAGAGAVAVLFAGSQPAWLGHDFWLELDSPETFATWVDAVVDHLGQDRLWLPVDRANGYALERYVRGTGRRMRMATGFAIRCLDNLVAAHATAAGRIADRDPAAKICMSTVAFGEYELDRLVVDLLLHRERAVEQRHLREHLEARRDEWYVALPRPSVKELVKRHYTRSGIPLEQAFPRAQAAIRTLERDAVDRLEVHGSAKLRDDVRAAYRAFVSSDRLPVTFADA
jgi:hypothetical protein